MKRIPNTTNIKIFSRQAIERACARQDIDKVIAIISITDVFEPLANISTNQNIKNCLRLQFDDVFEDEDAAMCQADADDIAEFLSNTEFEELWIHCEGGVSRSAAVAAAISKHLYGDDMWVFQNPNYYPNLWVNKLTTEALGDVWDWDEFKRKMNINIQIYHERCDYNG
jgi:predicted protein tyrosine phosphatase